MEKVIWWNTFCGNQSVYNAFWNSNLTINTDLPDFSVCFQRSVLTWLPSLYLWGICLFYLPFLLNRPIYFKGWVTSKFNLIKVTTILTLTILSVVELVWFLAGTSSSASPSSPHSPSYYIIHPVDYTSSLLKTVTFLLAGALTHNTYRRGIHSSGILFVYWFLQAFFSIAIFRSLFIRDEGRFIQSSTTLGFCFSIISFIFCLFSDLLPSQILHHMHQTPSYHSYVTTDEDGGGGGEMRVEVVGAGEKMRVVEDEEKCGHVFELGGMNGKTPKSYETRGEYSNDLLLSDKSAGSDGGDEGPLCPKLTAPFFSILLFFWFIPTIIKGWRLTLLSSDIFKLRVEDSSATITPLFLNNWKQVRKEAVQKQLIKEAKEKANGRISSKKTKKDLKDGEKESKAGEGGVVRASLMTALWRTFKTPFLVAGLLCLFYDFILFINPFLLNQLLDFVRSGDGFTWHGCVYSAGMFLASISGMICMSHSFNLLYTAGMRAKTALTTAIYRKALTISAKERQSSTVGEIVNMMSVDTQKVGDSLNLIHYIWSSPLILTLAIVALWRIIGPSTMAGVGFLLVFLPINSMVLAKLIRSFQGVQMKLKDSRLKLMNQILIGIRILKLYAWEDYFTEKILQIRQKELNNLRKSQTVGAITYVMWFCSSFVVALLCFTTYVLVSPTNILDPTTAFVSLSLIMLMNFPLTILPPAIMLLVQAIVSIKRIEKFLLKEDLDVNSVTHNVDAVNAISIKDGRFSWNDDDQSVSLEDIQLQVRHRELLAVVGVVGCGKSSLLSAILGEVTKLQGTVNVEGRIAYVAQQAWIQNLSLRDNILFDLPFDPTKYNKVIQACALQPDIDILLDGDLTEIGERGINLSGGQKQRISLARAVYHDADVYLLDDTLSAVDAHVSKHIFEQVLGPEGLLKNKTRVLVTHHIALLPRVDRVVVMEGGRIREEGSVDELVEVNGKFAEFLRTHLSEHKDEEEDEVVLQLQKKVLAISPEASDDDQLKGPSLPTSAASSPTQSSHMLLKSLTSVDSLQARKRKEEPTVADPNKVLISKLIQEEVSQEGAIKLSVLKSYIGASPPIYPILLLISASLFITAYVCTNIWLSRWSMDPVVNGTQDVSQSKYRIGVYAGLGGVQSFCMIGVISSIILGCLEASKNLHAKLLHNIVRSPMSFFDTVPTGRILNRFSKDIDILDSNIPQFSQNLTTTLCPLIGVIVIISYTTAYFILVVIPLLIFFIFLQRVYVACARQIKRIDSVKKSPVYAFFSESLAGTPTIRAYRQQKRFIMGSDKLVDESQRVWFEVFTSNRWMGIWSEFIADVMILFTSFFAVLQRDNLDPSLIGLALSFAFQINVNILMVVRSTCELETYIVAAERIKEYTEVEDEGEWYIEDKRVPEGWPGKGEVQFNGYSTRYREGLDYVLKGINLSIKSEEKVGIVGRTGAGKSSMSLALFRMIEASLGSICIDGVNLGEVGLHDVRKNLTVIPQDPVLFSGSLRFNLDPADHFTDAQIWTALEQAHLKTYIDTLPGNISYDCGENGASLSVGQRQLLCLARALLRRSKVLVLDEATAAIDLETDSLIQSTIREQFNNCTILTIAHRINTIMDYDRILVLDKGEVKEFASPEDLLANDKSMFSALVRDAGL